MTRIERWLIGWARIFDGLVCVLTLTLYRPSVATDIQIWSMVRRCDRIANGKEDAE